MSFGLSKGNLSPIALDFGVSSLKAIQVAGDDPPQLVAAARLPTPDELLTKDRDRLAYQASALPKLLKGAGFRGKRALFSISALSTFVHQFLQPVTPGVTAREALQQQLLTVVGIDPAQMIIKQIDVGEFVHGGTKHRAVMCVAMPREIVMAYMDAVRSCRLDSVGVHSEHVAALRLFTMAAPPKAKGDAVFVYVGYVSTMVVVAQGARLVLGKTIFLGGRDFDAAAAGTHRCPATEARDRRMRGEAGFLPARGGESAGEPEPAPLATTREPDAAGAASAVAEATDTQIVPRGRTHSAAPLQALVEEIDMCLAHHRKVFPAAAIDRLVFFGGESRTPGVCEAVGEALGLAVHAADPTAGLEGQRSAALRGVTFDEPQPGWATPLGLCFCATDL